MNLLKLFQLTEELSSVHRFSTNFLVKPESVLEHTGSVVLFSILIAQELNREFEVDIDYEKLAKKSVLHDIEESKTGDIPRSTKYCDPGVKHHLENYETHAVHSIQADLNLQSDIIDNWKYAKSGFEGLIIKVSDMITVTYKLWYEIDQLSNKSLIPVATESINNYNNIINSIRNFQILANQNDKPEIYASCNYLINICHRGMEINKSLF